MIKYSCVENYYTNLIKFGGITLDIRSTNIWGYVSSYSEEVTGSNILVKVNWSDGREVKFVIDCGLFQEKKWESNNYEKFPYKPEEIDFAIATHFHTDHIGRFPYLMKEGFTGKIYTTVESKTMFPLMLGFTADIMADNYSKRIAEWKTERNKRKKEMPHEKRHNSKFKGKKKQHFEFKSKDILNDKPELLFTRQDVRKLQAQVEGMEFETAFSPYEGVSIKFYSNGHMLGAAITVITLKYESEEINIMVTGDYAERNTVTGVESFVPEKVLSKIDLVISESTYGASPKVRDITKDYNLHLELIEDTIKNHKKMVYMVNAVERPLVVLRELQYIMEHEKIGEELSKYKIYFDSTSGIAALHAYDRIMGSEALNLPSNFECITTDNRNEVFNALSRNEPVFLMVTSPQFTQGSFAIYADKLLQDSRANIMFCSYVPECVSNIVNIPRSAQMMYKGVKLKKNCSMYKVGHFSSHATISDMKRLLDKCDNKNTILFFHGTSDAKNNMVQYFSDSQTTTYAMLNGKTVRFNKKGITKVY